MSYQTFWLADSFQLQLCLCYSAANFTIFNITIVIVVFIITILMITIIITIVFTIIITTTTITIIITPTITIIITITTITVITTTTIKIIIIITTITIIITTTITIIIAITIVVIIITIITVIIIITKIFFCLLRKRVQISFRFSLNGAECARALTFTLKSQKIERFTSELSWLFPEFSFLCHCQKISEKFWTEKNYWHKIFDFVFGFFHRK